MRLMYLFLRSRRVAASLLCLLGVGVITYWMARTDFAFRVPLDNESVSIKAVFLIPLAGAVVISASTFSPFGEVEHIASRSLSLFRCIHLVGLFIGGAVMLLLSASIWKEAQAEIILLRNLGGFVGLALLGIPLLGSRLSWVVAFIFGMLALRLGVLGVGRAVWWAWPFHPAQNSLAATMALVLGVLGLAYACFAPRYEGTGEVA